MANQNNSPKTIVLIACVSMKRDTKMKAKDLYISPLFKFSLVYAEKLKPNKIFILSAKHHLLDLETEIEPYNVTLSNIPKKNRKEGTTFLNAAEKKEWGKKVIEQLSKVSDLKNDKFIILAGQSYSTPLKGSMKFENPLEGLQQGKRLQYLKNNSL
jgi:hypothetical protein